MSLLDRRQLLANGLAGFVAACSRSATDDTGTLLVGDQRGGQKVVLDATGALRDLPYRIQWSSFPNAAPVLEALNAGAIDVGFGGDSAFVFAVGSGAKVKAIGGQRYEGPGPVLVVRGDSRIRTIDQIAGTRIATPRGSVSHNLILAALEHQGKPLDAVTFAFMSPQDGQAALQGGSVDGWAIWDPNATLAVRQGARIVGGSAGLVPSYALLFARDGALKTKRADLLDYRRRIDAGWQWGADNVDAYADLLAKETGVAADVWREVARRTKRLPAPINDALIADQQRTADRYFRAGLLQNKLDIRTGFDRSFS
ncbi:aliphatic sulfonate ABC transporter substrate-binding protein [Sphingomonas sp. CGMCC 1.13654]|uniref:Aliphatic sulfonate ABC transporter substrate-binding protein n=1 Tax=Sphingomonas chungangi TaxID=2683589 RepID=A0A838L3N0_9SPHN|nr:aliphatic sulfonate ABC transporter substrate-binding protein [Sphingomonas chungangi]MBA2933152.1 aliphatic sulfonate ABC transporter substrate-binding protein [Sphingomonas chungangi]MVW57824.1 aliphatic sulfonate ABC transporter substrate-binding protein [Sphingomonas chungangi]